MIVPARRAILFYPVTCFFENTFGERSIVGAVISERIAAAHEGVAELMSLEFSSVVRSAANAQR